MKAPEKYNFFYLACLSWCCPNLVIAQPL